MTDITEVKICNTSDFPKGGTISIHTGRVNGFWKTFFAWLFRISIYKEVLYFKVVEVKDATTLTVEPLD